MKTKTFLAISSMALAASLALPLTASAQPGNASCAPQGKHMHHSARGEHGMPGHAMRALDLTEAQRDQIFKIRQDQAQALYDQRKAERAAATKLRELSSASAFDEAQAQSLAQDLGKAQAQLALLRAQKHAKFLAVLTPEQREKLVELRERGPRGMHRGDKSSRS
ncbi:Spy/CpxP family protein refolding chaperone [Castellaniella sp. GW247-6E4]|uniref:Spy/CpxP family protein refolding chaperone n=1 Tax=Castellaniella sp. GW247-6E4 TaxID=3140380 RepID=UPI003314A4B4